MILIQDGSGSGDKITDALSAGSADGAILCGQYLQPQTLADRITALLASHSDKRLLFDPQLYAAVQQVAQTGKLTDYPYFEGSLSRISFSASKITSLAKSVVDYQVGVGLNQVLSGGMIMPSFNSGWSQINFQLYVATIEYFAAQSLSQDLYLSLPLSEDALSDDKALNEFLDEITALKVKGLYIIIERSTKISNWSDPEKLAKLLYLTYQLVQNDYEVIFGYTDLVGLLLQAFGATATATGWFQTQKLFSAEKYEPRTGGRQPKPTYTSVALMNTIQIDPDLQNIYEVGELANVLTGHSLDSRLTTDPATVTWSKNEEFAQYIDAVHKMSVMIDTKASFEEKLAEIERMIGSALAAYSALDTKHVQLLGKFSDSHLKVWSRAIQLVRDELGL